MPDEMKGIWHANRLASVLAFARTPHYKKLVQSTHFHYLELAVALSYKTIQIGNMGIAWVSIRLPNGSFNSCKHLSKYYNMANVCQRTEDILDLMADSTCRQHLPFYDFR